MSSCSLPCFWNHRQVWLRPRPDLMFIPILLHPVRDPGDLRVGDRPSELPALVEVGIERGKQGKERYLST